MSATPFGRLAYLVARAKARRLSRQRDWAAAISAYEAIAATPQARAADFIQLGHANKELGRYEIAHDCYRRAVMTEPSVADAYRHLGHLLLRLGRDDEAMHCFLSQHLLDPRDDSVRRHLADNGPRGERLDEAMISAAADLRRAIRYGPRARRRTLRTAAKASAAKVAAKGARWQVAARNYEALLKDDPLQSALMVRYARALEELGLADDARATLRNAAWSQPDCLDTQLRLARLLMSQKDWEGARAAFRKAAHMGLSRPVLDQELHRLGILEREADIAYWDALAREIRDNPPRSLSHQASAFLARHAQRWISAAPK